MSGVDYLIGEAKMYKNGTSQIYKRGGRGVCVLVGLGGFAPGGYRCDAQILENGLVPKINSGESPSG